MLYPHSNQQISTTRPDGSPITNQNLGSSSLLNTAMVNQNQTWTPEADFNPNAEGYQFDSTNKQDVTNMQSYLSTNINPQTGQPWYTNQAGTGAGELDQQWGNRSQTGYDAFKNQSILSADNTDPGNTEAIITKSKTDLESIPNLEDKPELDADGKPLLATALGNAKGPIADDDGVDGGNGNNGGNETNSGPDLSKLGSFKWQGPQYGQWKP